MLERDVRRLHMETIIQLPMQLLMSVQCRLGCCKNQIATGTNLLQTTYMERGIVSMRVSLSYDLLRSILLPSIWSAKDLSQLQFGSYSNLACIVQTSVTALGVGLWFPYATGGRRVPALILT